MLRYQTWRRKHNDLKKLGWTTKCMCVLKEGVPKTAFYTQKGDKRGGGLQKWNNNRGGKGGLQAGG